MRQLIKLFFISLIWLISSLLHAQEKDNWCRTRRIDFSREMNKKRLKKYFDTKKRGELIQMAWKESLDAKENSVAGPLYSYLAGTEIDNELRLYYRSILFLSANGRDASEVMKSWPKRGKVTELEIDLEKLCNLFKNSNGDLSLFLND